MNLLGRRKSLDALASEAEGSALSRSLTATTLVAMGVGAVVGAGIFVLPGQAAAEHAGPAVALSFLLAGLAAALAGLCYAELAAMIPVSGSAYTYTYATLGERVAWIIGWDLALEYLFGAATVANGWAAYLQSLLTDLGIPLPGWMTAGPLDHPAGLFDVPAAVLVLALTGLLLLGTRESARFSLVMMSTKVAVILLFVFFGLFHVDPRNWTPFVPPASGHFGEFGWSGVFRGAAIVFFAYAGFDALSATALETRNPQRDLPRGILGSLAICSILYVLVCMVMTGLVPYTRLDVAEPLAVSLDAAGPALRWLHLPLKVGALIGLTTGVLVTMLAQSRILFTMASDGLLPGFLARVHPRRKTPWAATLLVGGLAALAAGVLPLRILGEMVSIGTLLAFLLVSAGVLVLRRREPDRPRPFRTPFVPLVPLASIAITLALMADLPAGTWARLVLWLLLGLALYAGYGRRHSRLAEGPDS